ncbi:hypothetical protein BVRB_013810 [Beta vulgaris subsp. vulgaris]|uniref:Uncharacterized protein n=1 Tax=Beta vulgaris subsp. vulgaris TaxID=3555 RepID=A0A0J8B505_BETVV|nr:hypothetical protein BVRB_013810 [Beta vulgaris subsp. vulgaris]
MGHLNIEFSARTKTVKVLLRYINQLHTTHQSKIYLSQGSTDNTLWIMCNN